MIASGIDIIKHITTKKNKGSTTQIKENCDIKFTKKPNIYLILLESYQPSHVLKDIYNFDNTGICDFLKKHEFIIKNNVIANYTDTLSVLYAMMTMEHHFYKNKIGNDDIIAEARKVSLGALENPVLSTLKSNGYKFLFYDTEDYILGNTQDSAIDNTNLYFYAKYNPIYLLNPIFNISRRISNISSTSNIKSKFKKGAENPVTALIKFYAQHEDDPSFSLIHFGADHTTISESWDNIPKWEEKYCSLIEATNIEIKRLTTFLKENDPNAIVIFLGDHGACRYRNIYVGNAAYIKNIQQHGVDHELVARDFFNVFCAYHGIEDDNIFPDCFSHVNFFRYIFYYLSNDSTWIKHLEKDNSYLWHNLKKVIQVYSEGEILSTWHEVKKE